MLRRTLPILLVVSACAVPVTRSATAPGPGAPDRGASEPAHGVGVLVMAHGGTTEWNNMVAAALAPLSARLPTALAYGMASPYTLQAALDSLAESGATRIAVVRMFLSGESFLDQTEFYLGLSEQPPETFILMGEAAGDARARRPLAHDASVATHRDGLIVSPEAITIMVERAGALSLTPAEESVLIVAHGMGDEAENESVLGAMRDVASQVESLGFATVEVATLREDWQASRARAEAAIRRFVEREGEAGRRVIVLPMRLSGFGPYADVLNGLDYEAGSGLLPHRLVADWIENTAGGVMCAAGWGEALGPCPDLTAGTRPVR